jgi:acyl-CoA synthetase (AMP-forming)/AMP-acid ligase II
MDVGVSKLAVVANEHGDITHNFPATQSLGKALRRLRRANKDLARATRGSKTWHERKRRLQRIHAQVHFARLFGNHGDPRTGQSVAVSLPHGRKEFLELLIDGPIVGRCYLNDPQRTAAAYIDPPQWLRDFNSTNGDIGTGNRVYLTGDLVRYTSDGSISYVRRKDTQVKIRGQRAELRPRAPRAGGPPIMIAGTKPRMMSLIARGADRWGETPLRRGARSSGRPFPPTSGGSSSRTSAGALSGLSQRHLGWRATPARARGECARPA